MKSLIIGGSGFVGSYLAHHLVHAGHKVSITERRHGSCSILGIPIYNLDILDKENMKRILEKERPKYIFHLASQSSVASSWENPEQTIDINMKGSLNLLHTVHELNQEARILLVGSSEEYGKMITKEIPVGEDCKVRPENIYAVTKVCQNMIGRIYAQAYGMDIVMIRAFNHTGPNQLPIFVIADFCRQVAQIEAGKREPVVKVGNLEVRRDFTDVRDIVRAYALLAEKGKSGETYNVGSGHAVCLREVLQMILNQATVKIHVEPDPEKLRPLDVSVVQADISKIKCATGWEPVIGLEKTIKDTLDYWRVFEGKSDRTDKSKGM